ncbi:gamma-glutamylaminecyclotransferase C-like isoform X2 [Pseudorasbora parva]|uniref:gamma-glutamylaminecyclotransferase C-like isoform X2 n=1 Tax=Pseudorasbora parva TaxID=51549 RepID=UPI00351E13F8
MKGLLIFLVIASVCAAVHTAQVFVYGTLKKGQPNHFRMLDAAKGRAEFVAQARTVERYPLVIATKYNIPFLLNVPGTGQRVYGEIYSVDQKMLKFLDEFEMTPKMYQRTTVQLEVQDGPAEQENAPKPGSLIEAFVYSTTTYEPDWLQKQTYESYDAYGLGHVFSFIEESTKPQPEKDSNLESNTEGVTRNQECNGRLRPL